MNRRDMLAASAAAFALPAFAAPALAEGNDPLLQAIVDMEAGDAAYNALPDELTNNRELQSAVIAATYGPPYDRLRFDPPPATTRAGALAALRLARDYEVEDEIVPNMIAAALAFFEAERQP